MPIHVQQLARLNADYSEVTGSAVKHFVCPITLADDGTDLCDGHILNESIDQAARATVIQRRHVDNYFGYMLEPDLVKMLNMATNSPAELIRQANNLTIAHPDTGEKMETFWADRKALQKFQRLDLFDREGKTVASPFLRSERLELKRHHDLEVEWTITVTNSAIVGSLLKSAYLAMFWLIGYRSVLDIAGDKVRRALAAFYVDRAGKGNSIDYFWEYVGSVSLLVNDLPDDYPDTLEGGSLWFHYAEGDQDKGILFGITCLFRVNGRILTVTLPGHQKEGYWFVAYQYYQAFLKDRSMKHDVYHGRFHDETFQVSPKPIQLKFAG